MDICGFEIEVNCPLMVFGDGKHETTKSLLDFLHKYGEEDMSYVDIGCGTGILSIFASKIGMNPIIAIDCDKHATDCTKDNMVRNGVDNIEVIANAVERVNDIYGDIVTGNFPQAIGAWMLPILSRFVNDGGLLITTWYKDMKPIEDELPKGFDIIDHIEGIEYDCYVLKKKGQNNETVERNV